MYFVWIVWLLVSVSFMVLVFILKLLVVCGKVCIVWVKCSVVFSVCLISDDLVIYVSWGVLVV